MLNLDNLYLNEVQFLEISFILYSKLRLLAYSTGWHISCYENYRSPDKPICVNFFQEDIMKNTSSGWGIGAIAFLSGVALGIAGGLLWAPQSGTRTREDLQDLATDAFDRAEGWMETAKNTMDDLIEKGKTTVKVG